MVISGASSLPLGVSGLIKEQIISFQLYRIWDSLGDQAQVNSST